MRLSREDTILLFASAPYLSREAEQRLRAVCAQEVNWAYVAWRAENNRTVPLVHHHLDRLNRLRLLPDEVRTYLQRWTALSNLRSLVQFRHLSIILESLEQAGIPHFLVKGPDLALLYYPDPFVRPMTDLDIMVRPVDVFRVQQLMFELGYAHGIFNPANGAWTPEDKPIGKETFRDTYALPVFVRTEKLESPFAAEEIPAKLRHRHIKAFIDRQRVMHLPVFVDIHFNLSVGLAEEDVWAGVELAKVLDRVVRVQSPTAAIWFLAARVYHEAFLYNSLRLVMLGDLHAVLQKRGEEIDWAAVAAVAYRYEMRPALYYVLSQMERIFGLPVPPAFLELIQPDQREIPLQHDWGDIIPKLFSVPHLNSVEFA